MPTPVTACHLLLLVAVLACAPACSVDRAGLAVDDGGGIDAGCEPSGAEVCNGRDDDCNGAIDEGFDLSADLMNCGICGMACVAGSRGTAACASGRCELICDAGFADCNGVASDGCEAALSDAATCGLCGNDCTGTAAPLCMDDGAGFFSCVDTCELPAEICGASCVDVTRSTAHCGGCDMACPDRASATASCASSACEYACASGFGDCDTDAATGCETNTRTTTDCDGCGVPCTLANATASCATGTCVFSACNAGFGDCDADPASGCETLLATLADCGACGQPCAFANAPSSCATGMCVMGACNPGFADCDTLPGTGCEADLGSTATCGSCGRSCGAGEGCAGGACVGPTAVVEIGAGVEFACARIADGRVFCWGANGSGQLGNGTTTASTSAVAVSGIGDAIDLAVGALHACVVRAGGTVSCWGENARQRLGDGTTMNRSTPIANAGGLTDARQISAGGEHTCVVRATGAVSCWGRDNVGQLGDGPAGGDRGNGVDVVSLGTAIQVECGGAHTCAVLDSGEVRCWGENGASQLGDGTTTNRTAPVRAGLLSDAVQLSAGEDFTCAVRAGGSVECWGSNDQGQLGDGTTTGRGTTAPVATLAVAVQVSSGVDHTCARSGAGTLWCWGSNGSGRLGDSTTTSRTMPVTVTGAMPVIDVAAGTEHTCAARVSGSAICWGKNGLGQLGDGTTTDRSAPVTVMGLP